jgi:hypothetical protein
MDATLALARKLAVQPTTSFSFGKNIHAARW